MHAAQYNACTYCSSLRKAPLLLRSLLVRVDQIGVLPLQPAEPLQTIRLPLVCIEKKLVKREGGKRVK